MISATKRKKAQCTFRNVQLQRLRHVKLYITASLSMVKITLIGATFFGWIVVKNLAGRVNGNGVTITTHSP